jgi:hypothetical protein
MRELADKDGFNPVVELLETDDGRELAVFYAYFRPSVI